MPLSQPSLRKEDRMTITIEAEPKEIAALVVAIQEWREREDRLALEIISRLQDAVDQQPEVFQL